MDKIGKYEITTALGKGATSAVYLGYDPFMQREVAIKTVFPEILKDPVRGRAYQRLLINEASLAGKLVHPHIVQIYDAVVSEDQSYIVMEYVAGGTLERFCSPQALLPLDRLVEIIFKCTRALDYAYHQGITHRDIKPANILLVHPDKADGDIKVSDFGAALLAGTDITQVSGVGSPAYMSPQQVREMPLTHQTDIYSLGVVMYQLLTGRLPFNATNNYGMVHQITSAEAPAPSVFRRDIPASIEAIVARAMNKDLEQRYANWEEFSHDLAQAFRNRQLKERAQSIADSEKFQTLRRLPFFREFSDVEIWEVVRFSDWDEICPGTVIMKDGEPGDYFCFLAEGEVKVVKRGRLLSILNVGDCFGEMAVVTQTGGARGADIVAVTDSRIVTIRGRAIRQASEVCRMNFYRAFLEVIISRLSQANSRIAGEA
jgi:serine/threonine protein kinase